MVSHFSENQSFQLRLQYINVDYTGQTQTYLQFNHISVNPYYQISIK